MLRNQGIAPAGIPLEHRYSGLREQQSKMEAAGANRESTQPQHAGEIENPIHGTYSQRSEMVTPRNPAKLLA